MAVGSLRGPYSEAHTLMVSPWYTIWVLLPPSRLAALIAP